MKERKVTFEIGLAAADKIVKSVLREHKKIIVKNNKSIKKSTDNENVQIQYEKNLKLIDAINNVLKCLKD